MITFRNQQHVIIRKRIRNHFQGTFNFKGQSFFTEPGQLIREELSRTTLTVYHIDTFCNGGVQGTEVQQLLQHKAVVVIHGTT
ncbi:hypothetical protein D3C87_1966300 [compost metagenome]